LDQCSKLDACCTSFGDFNIKLIENSNGEPPCPIQLTGIVEVAGRGGAGRGGEEQWGYVRMPDRCMDDGRNVKVQGV
jgi:hypothetical protein